MFATDNVTSRASSTARQHDASEADTGSSASTADERPQPAEARQPAPGQTLAELNQQTASLLARFTASPDGAASPAKQAKKPDPKPDPKSGPAVAGDPSGAPPVVTQADIPRIRRDYQVSDDPGGVIQWKPSGLTGWLARKFGGDPDAAQVTASEGKLLDSLGALSLRTMSEVRDDARETANARFPSQARIPGNDDQTDAFRHAYWNARMTREFGQDFAQDYGNAHERVPGNTPNREAMDLYNNEVGRRIAHENPGVSDKKLADLIEQAVRDGKMVVLDGNGNLVPSNTVKPDETGHERDNAPALPGKAPAPAQS